MEADRLTKHKDCPGNRRAVGEMGDQMARVVLLGKYGSQGPTAGHRSQLGCI